MGEVFGNLKHSLCHHVPIYPSSYPTTIAFRVRIIIMKNACILILTASRWRFFIFRQFLICQGSGVPRNRASKCRTHQAPSPWLPWPFHTAIFVPPWAGLITTSSPPCHNLESLRGMVWPTGCQSKTGGKKYVDNLASVATVQKQGSYFMGWVGQNSGDAHQSLFVPRFHYKVLFEEDQGVKGI